MGERGQHRGTQTSGASLSGSSFSERPLYVGGDDVEGLLSAERDFVFGEDAPRADEAAVGRALPGSRGLALSGGGIRSAAFSLGVMQALVAGGQLSSFHYLSTASGGGYTGSALTYWLDRGLPNGAGTAGTSAEDFPFGSLRSEGKAPSQNAVLDFLRMHASYLTPTPALGLASLVAVVLRSAFLSLFIYFTLLMGAFGLALCWHLFDPLPDSYFGPFRWLRIYLSSPLLYGSALLFFLFLVAALVYSLTTRFSRGSHSYGFRTAVQGYVGRALVVGLGATAIGLLPWVYFVLSALVHRVTDSDSLFSEQYSALFSAALSLVGGTLLGAREGHRLQSGAAVANKGSRRRLLLALGLVLYGLLLGALSVADGLRGAGAETRFFLGTVAAGLVLGWFSNVNYLGAHRMYRDRLMELFMPNPRAAWLGRWEAARSADVTGLHQVCGVPDGVCRRPYHLINTNVVLIDSPRSAERGRGGDSFVLSPLYVGSAATGWVRSDRYMNASGGKGMSLPSAMAISGAAVNPNTAPGGNGLGRGRLMSALLHLLNLRLGYWAPNPARERSLIPNFIQPGLAALFGRGFREDAALIELSDGGHFENLAIYELLRRRTALIVVVDGAEDSDYAFGDLANAVERARVDFGAKISFEDPRAPLTGLLPRTSSDGADLAVGKFSLAERAFALGRVRYAGDGAGQASGHIVYIKATLFPGLPPDVLGYKLAEPAFPNQSTGDQFFDERQFEAYRELGYYAGWNALEKSGLLGSHPSPA